MYALNVNKINVQTVLSRSVFPRLYRRFVRFMFEFVFTAVHVPRYFGSCAVVFFFLVTLLYGISVNGHMEMVVKATLSDIGFVITNVDVNGNKRVAKQEILRLLGLDVSPSIFIFDVDRARSILEQQTWIKSAHVQKIYPNRVRVSVVEREPYAVWQHDGMVDIIDNVGCVIVPFTKELVQGLPLVVGQGAQNAARTFIQALSAYPQLYDRVHAYVRVGDRRWDLVLNNGVRVMLPESGALKRIASLIKTGAVQDLFSRDILSVDLRLFDRITVSLSDEALERRSAAVAEEERLLKMQKAGGI
ncbi:cell division protein FtsQ/DivIB [Bartonella sp. CB175]|uniref:cell division protein FtsQ/DivIB n=1 Tax=Bartonella sp. CB175 TaxID=3112256 RepID=UPI00300E61DC